MADSDRAERTVVVGAGVSGLACARVLKAAGRRVVVVERSACIGGRCATRRIEGQAIDFGVPFFHGRDRAFLDTLAAVPATPIPGWPVVVRGVGRPCQPEAFAPGERRLAFVEGMSALPKFLARGLDIRTGERVISFTIEDRGIRLDLEGGRSASARTLVMAVAAEQALELLSATPSTAHALSTARALLAMVRTQPCLTVLALYGLTASGTGPSAKAPAWHTFYPEDSKILQILSHDSSKREGPPYLSMVYQANPAWSREHLGDDDFQKPMLAEAARLLGPWAAAPLFVQCHRFRYARTDLGAELSAPLLLTLPGGGRLGFAGEIFAPGGGVEAAWVSGNRLARKILAEES